jgi:hypothetical protein
MRNYFKIMMVKPDGKGSVWIPKRRWKDDIKTHLRVLGVLRRGFDSIILG